MLNSTKTWQKEEQQFINQSANDINNELGKTWQEELNKDAYFDEKIGEMVLEIKYITKIVADIRKRDMEALIGMLPKEISMSVAIDTNSDAGAGHTIGHNYLLKEIKKLIKDYYEN